jgi:Transcriptional regulators
MKVERVMEKNQEVKFESLNKGTIVEQIIQSITDSIIRGKYKAGMKLPNEYELINEFQISRNSLREAMKILSAMGIVDIKRGDGTYVSSQINPSIFDTVVYSMIYDLSTNSELLELRQILDEATVRLAIDKITREELDELYKNVDSMEEALKKGDILKSQEYDYAFHMKLIESCKNTFFVRILKGVYSIFEKSITTNVEKEKEDSLAPYYHRNILTCIEKKDYENIGKVVADSLITWYETIKQE